MSTLKRPRRAVTSASCNGSVTATVPIEQNGEPGGGDVVVRRCFLRPAGPKMLKQCATVTCILLVVSLISKLCVESADLSHTQVLVRLVDKALHWNDVARSDTDPVSRHHHLIAALTFLQAAREIVPDSQMKGHGRRCVDMHETTRTPNIACPSVCHTPH